jgi:hypothetical protein
MKRCQPKVILHDAHGGMCRVRWPDGRLSDMTNLTRAKDAVASFIETEEHRRRWRHRPSGDRLCAKTGERPAGGAIVPASGEHRVVVSENGGARKQ